MFLSKKKRQKLLQEKADAFQAEFRALSQKYNMDFFAVLDVSDLVNGIKPKLVIAPLPEKPEEKK